MSGQSARGGQAVLGWWPQWLPRRPRSVARGAGSVWAPSLAKSYLAPAIVHSGCTDATAGPCNAERTQHSGPAEIHATAPADHWTRSDRPSQAATVTCGGEARSILGLPLPSARMRRRWPSFRQPGVMFRESDLSPLRILIRIGRVPTHIPILMGTPCMYTGDPYTYRDTCIHVRGCFYV